MITPGDLDANGFIRQGKIVDYLEQARYGAAFERQKAALSSRHASKSKRDNDIESHSLALMMQPVAMWLEVTARGMCHFAPYSCPLFMHNFLLALVP
jgi:hypothetical protein